MMVSVKTCICVLNWSYSTCSHCLMMMTMMMAKKRKNYYFYFIIFLKLWSVRVHKWSRRWFLIRPAPLESLNLWWHQFPSQITHWITFGPLCPVWGMGVTEALPGHGSRHTQCISLHSACWSECARWCLCSSLHPWIPSRSVGKTGERKNTHHRFCGGSKTIFHILIGDLESHTASWMYAPHAYFPFFPCARSKV